MNELNYPLGFDRAKEAAEKLAAEQERLRRTLEEALHKAEEKKKYLKDFWDDLISLIQLIKAYLNKEYTRVPWKTIVFALAAIVYFLNPFDVIPDLIPTVGFLDDATVIAFVLNAIKEDLQNFKQYQRQASKTSLVNE